MLNQDRSSAFSIAIWLFVIAALVFSIVIVGGATRLTGSGLSITEWAPVKGAIPPLSDADWLAAFAKYKQTSQYRLVNQGLELGAFKSLFLWEWGHRLLGRLIGVVALLPLALFFFAKKIPQRLAVRLFFVPVLIGLQGALGWWMVQSGLEGRASVAPERLALHLGSGLFVFAFTFWTGLEAAAGEARVRPPRRYTAAATAILALISCQILLGALVAGNQAGRIYTDWPLMDGRIIGPVNLNRGVAAAFLGDAALVQFDHRIGAYGVVIAVLLFTASLWRGRAPVRARGAAVALALGVCAQATLGVVTLMHAAPLDLALAHQALAVVVLALAVNLVWGVRRAGGMFW